VENLVFFTYFLALIAIAVSLYALYQLECVKENMNRKTKNTQKHYIKPVSKPKSKGHFDGYR
jgi:hypothetical protein